MQSAKECFSAITIKLITPRFTGLQWVCVLLLYNLYSYTLLLLVLHPWHKLKYFKTAGWEEYWINEAEAIVHAEFDKSYGSLDLGWAKQASKYNVCVFELLFFSKVLYLLSLRPPLPDLKNIFDNLPALQAPKPSGLCGELDKYLDRDPVDVSDALAWWHENRNVFPCLHRMALDYLSIPGKSQLANLVAALIN